ncbi:hypothetical protein RUND412_004123 [Rhizina undulata]
MATEVMSPAIASPNSQTQQQVFVDDIEEEMREYEKIIKLRNDIYAGNHPRFKPPAPPSSASRPVSQGSAPPAVLSAEKNRPPPPVVAPRAAQPQNKSPGSSSQMSETEISKILLAKSDVLIKAEIQLKRQRLERQVKEQLEQRQQARLGLDGREEDVEDNEQILDLEEVVAKAGVPYRPLARPEGHSAKRARSVVDDDGYEPPEAEVDLSTGETAPPPPRQMMMEEDRPNMQVDETSRKPPVESSGAVATSYSSINASTGWPEPLVSRTGQLDNGYTALRDGGVSRLSSRGTDVPSAREGAPIVNSLPAARQLARDAGGSIPERVYTSQVRSPAAPQPIRPANMARVNSREHEIIEIYDDISVERYGNEPRKEMYGGRQSPSAYIKPEPATPPNENLRRSPSPVKPPRDLGRSEYAGRYRYEYPPIPIPHGYHYPPPPLPHAPLNHAYDPYIYREADPYYPPPPVDYARRPYTPGYLPPPVPPYYASRAAYEDYDRRYPPPPPPVLARQPSRVARRSASPPYIQRRSSRSVSPPAVQSRRASPRPTHAEYPVSRTRVAAASPSPVPRVDYYGRPVLPPYPDYGHLYRHSRERSIYYDDRGAYYPPPPPPPPPLRYVDEPSVRPESSVAPRESDIRSYREREYHYAPTVLARQLIPPPPLPPVGAGYMLPPRDYVKAPSRAPVAQPSEDARISEREYGRASVRSEEREFRDRPIATRQEERGYLPARHPSVRPEASSGYREMEYRPARQTSEQERDGYGSEGPAPRPGSYAGSGYGNGNYGRY